MQTQNDIRQKVTAQIIEAMKLGTPPWKKPWRANGGGLPTNVVTNRRYSGVNILLLNLHCARHHLVSNVFGTFNQWKAIGCRVKARPTNVNPGDWGCSIVFTKPITKVEIDDEGEEEEVAFRILRQYTVFSADQVVGEAAERIICQNASVATPSLDYHASELAINSIGADVRFGSDKALYVRPRTEGGGDFIICPHKNQFFHEKEFWSTLWHEHAHWSECRLGWNGSYAEGELRAEIATAFLLTELGESQSDDLSNHNAYIASWLKSLQSDPRFILRCSADASKAVDYLLSFSRRTNKEPLIVV